MIEFPDEIDEKQQYDYYIPHMELRDTLVHNRWNEYAGDSVEITLRPVISGQAERQK